MGGLPALVLRVPDKQATTTGKGGQAAHGTQPARGTQAAHGTQPDTSMLTDY